MTPLTRADIERIRDDAAACGKPLECEGRMDTDQHRIESGDVRDLATTALGLMDAEKVCGCGIFETELRCGLNCPCDCHVLWARRQEWKDIARTAEARIVRLEEGLRAMLDEHFALGQHASGETEYCSYPACAKAAALLSERDERQYDEACVSGACEEPCPCACHTERDDFGKGVTPE